jgi:hypothetical protein
MKEIINHKDLNNTENLLCPTKQILGRVLNLITRVGEWRGAKDKRSDSLSSCVEINQNSTFS